MAENKPYEGKAEMFNVPPLNELLNHPVFDAASNEQRTALHHLLEQEEGETNAK